MVVIWSTDIFPYKCTCIALNPISILGAKYKESLSQYFTGTDQYHTSKWKWKYGPDLLCIQSLHPYQLSLSCGKIGGFSPPLLTGSALKKWQTAQTQFVESLRICLNLTKKTRPNKGVIIYFHRTLQLCYFFFYFVAILQSKYEEKELSINFHRFFFVCWNFCTCQNFLLTFTTKKRIFCLISSKWEEVLK